MKQMFYSKQKTKIYYDYIDVLGSIYIYITKKFIMN